MPEKYVSDRRLNPSPFPSPHWGEGGVRGRYALCALRYALFRGGRDAKTYTF
jgi:hypothetical protein